MIQYLLTIFAATQTRLQARTRQAELGDAGWNERGASAIELAVIAAGLLAVAIALVAIVTSAVGNHDANIK